MYSVYINYGSVVRAPVDEEGGPGFNSRLCPRIFFSSSWLSNAYGMKKALYQHRYSECLGPIYNIS